MTKSYCDQRSGLNQVAAAPTIRARRLRGDHL